MKNALLLALLACAGARADDSISADRPNFTNSPDVVAAGRFQFEAGAAWQRDRADGVSTRLRSTPLLLRLGVGQDLELRLDSNGALRQSPPGVSGRGDFGLGFKWRQQDGGDGRPALGWLFDLQTPSGSGPFKGSGLRPTLSGLAQWDLPAGYSLGAMAGVLTANDASGGRYTAGLLSANLGIPLGERLQGFAEIAGQQLAARRNGGNVVTAGTGFSWPLGDDAQLDAAVFRGLTRATPDWAWTLGLSLRY